VDEAGSEPEVDQEFEDACLALAMADGPKPRPSNPDESAPAVSQADVVGSFPVATAADLAEDDGDADGASTDVGTAVPQALVPEPTQTVPAHTGERIATPAGIDPRSGRGPVAEAISVLRPEPGRATSSSDAELAAAKAELESLRADFQAERFRARDERVRLEDELATARSRSSADADQLGDGGAELSSLRREVDALRGELVEVRARHAEELAQLRTELKAAQAREAQTIISAQLAEDELKAMRADHEATRQALQTTRSQGAAGQADLEAANAAFDESLKASARDLSAAQAERDALRQLLSEVDAKESALAAQWESERHALQDQIRGAMGAGDLRVRQVEAKLADRDNDLRIARESAAELVRGLERQLAAKEAELAVTQQELLDAEMRRADEAASFLQALQK
jgi:hypothetical protein